MQLEVLTPAEQPVQPRDVLLFVHGGWHAAWCWQEHVMPYVAQRGYAAHALTLREASGPVS